jgi:hypothetical protein
LGIFLTGLSHTTPTTKRPDIPKSIYDKQRKQAA